MIVDFGGEGKGNGGLRSNGINENGVDYPISIPLCFPYPGGPKDSFKSRDGYPEAKA